MDVIAWHANSRAKVNYAEAETYYLEALSLNPSYTPILKAYADATYATGDCEKAVGVFEDLLEVAPPYWKWKDDFETRTPMQQKSYRIFYKNVPDFKWVFGRLRKCYTKLENEEKALYYSQYEEPFKGLNIQY